MSGHTKEPVLLTEAGWRARIDASDHFTELAIAALHSAGLIAPEPETELRRALNSATEYFRHEDGGFLSAQDIDGLIEAVRPFLAPAARLTLDELSLAVEAARPFGAGFNIRLHTALTQQMEGRDG